MDEGKGIFLKKKINSLSKHYIFENCFEVSQSFSIYS